MVEQSKTRSEYAQANRSAWNLAAPRHAAYSHKKYLEWFKQPGFVTLEGEILETLQRVGVSGKSVIQLC